MGTYLMGIDNSPVPAPSIRRDCIRLETRQGGEFSIFERVIPCVVRCEGRVHGQDLRWSRELTSVRGRTNRVGARALEQRVRRHAQEDKETIQDERAMNFPLIVSYGTGRLWIEPRATEQALSAVRQPLGKASRFEAYRGCLEPTVSSELLRRWIKKMALIAHQNQKPLQSLDAVYGAVVGCVEGVEKAEYDFDMDDIVLDFKNGERFPFDLLSDGQRTMTALAADVAWHCVQLNPQLGGQALRETKGVVLIDELDLHLHPNWQRMIVNNLLSLFPKLQFIATTHSPFIVQSLDGQGLINLSEDSLLQERKDPYSIEDVAEETMGVEAPQRSQRFLEMETAAQRYYQLLDKLRDDKHPDVAQAKRELDRIEADFSDNPAYAALLKLHRYAAE
ncbi:MAG: AAA family ATPase [Cyanobacteria bacterium MAG CAR3_bin_5]|nr:AAA family ATPase [Cyanobacteria bacterium MAG CAR3_bin_5]